MRESIDYGFSEAQTVYGKIGVKCWICKKEVRQRCLSSSPMGGCPNPQIADETFKYQYIPMALAPCSHQIPQIPKGVSRWKRKAWQHARFWRVRTSIPVPWSHDRPAD
jgi:hypothetical protein